MMSRKIFCLLPLLIFFLVACRSDSRSSTETIKWHGYDEGIKIGETQERKCC